MRGIVLILILYWYGISVSQASGNCTLYAASGDNFIIQLEYKNLKEDDELTWKKDSDIVYMKKKNTEKINTKVVSSSGSLQLIDLKISDSANYSVEVFDKDGNFLTNAWKWLCVIEKILLKPHIQQSDCSKPLLTLTCSVEKPNDVKYVWHKNKKEVKETTKTLIEKKEKRKSSDTFSCNVSNEVSYQKSDDITITCPGDKLFGVDFRVMVAILATGGCLVLILILVLMVYACRRLKQNKNRNREEEDLRLMHMPQAHPPRPQEAPRSHAAPYTHPQNGEEYTPPPPRPRGKRPRPPPVPVTDEEKPPPRPKPRQSAPRHNRT